MNSGKVTFLSGQHRLQGNLATPDAPVGAAVICHPHPLMGGNMSSILVPALQRALLVAGWACLRFNFRGVGLSEGKYEAGLGEQQDVRAALDLIAQEFPGVPLAVAGWSFGALVALSGAAGDARVRAYAAITPPVSHVDEVEIPENPPPERLSDWKVAAISVCGTRDDYSQPQDVQAWSKGCFGDRGRVEIYEDADHFMSGAQAEMLAEIVKVFEEARASA